MFEKRRDEYQDASTGVVGGIGLYKFLLGAKTSIKHS